MAAKRLVIVGKFNSASTPPVVLKGTDLSRIAFFEKVKPGLGREYQDISIGGQIFQSIRLRLPSKAKVTQPLQADSPLFLDPGSAEWDEIGKQQFTRLVSLTDELQGFQHPTFSKDLLQLAVDYISDAVTGTQQLGSSWSDLPLDPALASQLCNYLLSPVSDEEAILAAWTKELSKKRNEYLGQVDEKVIAKAAADLKTSLATDVSGDGLLDQVAGEDEAFARYDSTDLALPKLEHFAGYYRRFRLASDDLHARLRSPELYSYIVWWWVKGYGDAMSQAGALGARDVAKAFEIGIAAKGLDRKRGLTTEQRKDQAKATQEIRSIALRDVDDKNKELYGRLLDDLFEAFDRRWDVARPLERSDMIDRVTSLFESLAVMGMPWYEKLKAEVEAKAVEFRGADQIILNEPEDLPAELRQWAQANSQKEFMEEFLAAYPSPTHVGFYGFSTNRFISESFAKLEKANQDKIEALQQRVGRFMRFLLEAQGALESKEITGGPALVHLPKESADLLKELLKAEKAKKTAQAQKEAVKKTFTLKANAGTALPAAGGRVVISGKGAAAEVKKLSDDPSDGPIEQKVVVEIEPAVLFQPDGVKILEAPVELGGNVQPLGDLLDDEAKKSLLRDLEPKKDETDSGLPEAVTAKDIEDWDQLVRGIHKRLQTDETQSFQRLYRATILGRYFLAAKDDAVPFGRKDLSNALGLIIELVSRYGQISGSGEQAQLKEIPPEERAKLNLSTAFPVATAAELANAMRGHREVIKGVRELQGYLEEVDAIGTAISKCARTGIEVVIINDQIDKSVAAFTGFPARQLYLSSQGGDANQVNQFLAELCGRARMPGAAAKTQLPVIIGRGHREPDPTLYALPAFSKRPGLLLVAQALACCDGAAKIPHLLAPDESVYESAPAGTWPEFVKLKFKPTLPLVQALANQLAQAEPTSTFRFEQLRADLLFRRALTVAILSADGAGAVPAGPFLFLVEHLCVLSGTSSTASVHEGFRKSLSGLTSNPGISKAGARHGIMKNVLSASLEITETPEGSGEENSWSFGVLTLDAPLELKNLAK